jgi:hypothetical protein
LAPFFYASPSNPALLILKFRSVHRPVISASRVASVYHRLAGMVQNFSRCRKSLIFAGMKQGIKTGLIMARIDEMKKLFCMM